MPNTLSLEVNIAPASVDAVGEFYTQNTQFSWLREQGERPVYLFHGYEQGGGSKQKNAKPVGRLVNDLGWKCREGDDTCGHYATVELSDETPYGKMLIERHKRGDQLYGSLGRWNPLSEVMANGEIVSVKAVELSLFPDDMGRPPANWHSRAYDTPADLKAAGLGDLAADLSSTERNEGMPPMAPLIPAEWFYTIMGALNFPNNDIFRAFELTPDPVTGIPSDASLTQLGDMVKTAFETYAQNTREVTMTAANTTFETQIDAMQDVIRRMQAEMTSLKADKLAVEARDWAAPRFPDPAVREVMQGRYVQLATAQQSMIEQAAALKMDAPATDVLKTFTESFPVVSIEAGDNTPAPLAAGGQVPTGQPAGEILKVHFPTRPNEKEADSAAVTAGLEMMGLVPEPAK